MTKLRSFNSIITLSLVMAQGASADGITNNVTGNTRLQVDDKGNEWLPLYQCYNDEKGSLDKYSANFTVYSYKAKGSTSKAPQIVFDGKFEDQPKRLFTSANSTTPSSVEYKSSLGDLKIDLATPIQKDDLVAGVVSQAGEVKTGQEAIDLLDAAYGHGKDFNGYFTPVGSQNAKHFVCEEQIPYGKVENKGEDVKKSASVAKPKKKSNALPEVTVTCKAGNSFDKTILALHDLISSLNDYGSKEYYFKHKMSKSDLTSEDDFMKKMLQKKLALMTPEEKSSYLNHLQKRAEMEVGFGKGEYFGKGSYMMLEKAHRANKDPAAQASLFNSINAAFTANPRLGMKLISHSVKENEALEFEMESAMHSSSYGEFEKRVKGTGANLPLLNEAAFKSIKDLSNREEEISKEHSIQIPEVNEEELKKLDKLQMPGEEMQRNY